MTRTPTYLLFDPWDEYAVEFIDLISHRWGLRPLCLYTDEKAAFYNRPKFPVLQSRKILGSFFVAPDDIAGAVRRLGERFDIKTAVPFLEKSVEQCAEALTELDAPFIAPETLLRFRDKHAMKAYLRKNAPDVRVPESQIVNTADDVRAIPFERFVLKPNSGFANSHVGIYDRTPEMQDALAHLDSAPGTTWICEEYVGGREFSINGQVDRHGQVFVYSVVEIRRRQEGHHTFYDLSHSVHTDAPEFALARRYAENILRGLRLSRSPFHMEAKLDERGFCMVDLGARLVGNLAIYNTQRTHGGQLEAFYLAAHDYLFDVDRPAPPIDWSVYDRNTFIRLFGTSTDTGMITSLRGVDDVEALPEFIDWLEKPFVGKELTLTDDLFTMPYAVDLGASRSLDEMLEVANRVRGMIAWNDPPASRRRIAQLRAKTLKDKIEQRARWEAYLRAPSAFPRLSLPRVDA